MRNKTITLDQLELIKLSKKISRSGGLPDTLLVPSFYACPNKDCDHKYALMMMIEKDKQPLFRCVNCEFTYELGEDEYRSTLLHNGLAIEREARS